MPSTSSALAEYLTICGAYWSVQDGLLSSARGADQEQRENHMDLWQYWQASQQWMVLLAHWAVDHIQD